MVVLGKHEYTNKGTGLTCSREGVYRPITMNPNEKHKNKLINFLRTIKAQGGLGDNTYKRLYPTDTGPPKLYGLPKLYKQGIPLDP